MKVVKMQGLGNDYLYVYGPVPENIAELSVRLSDRHFGFGSDGMIYITPSQIADFGMRIFNADGSEAKMCGNGIRCVGKYLFDRGYTDQTKLLIETLSGIKTLTLHPVSGQVKSVSVDMGRSVVDAGKNMTVDGRNLHLTPVNMGNPHAVVFVPEAADDALLYGLGPKIEKHPDFPGGVNVEFVQVVDPTTLRMRVWERGSGVTMACGTGACASVAAAVAKGFCPAGEAVTVRLDGGNLSITVSKDGRVEMTGPAEFVYEGETLC